MFFGIILFQNTKIIIYKRKNKKTSMIFLKIFAVAKA